MCSLKTDTALQLLMEADVILHLWSLRILEYFKGVKDNAVSLAGTFITSQYSAFLVTKCY